MTDITPVEASATAETPSAPEYFAGHAAYLFALLSTDLPHMRLYVAKLSYRPYVQFGMGADGVSEIQYQRRVKTSATLIAHLLGPKAFTYLMTTMPEVALCTSHYLLGQCLKTPKMTETHFREFYTSAMLSEMLVHASPKDPLGYLDTMVNNLDLAAEWKDKLFRVPYFRFGPAMFPRLH